jgi:hypothetical protein
MLATNQSRTFCLLVLSTNVKNRIYKTRILPVVLYGCETWSLTEGVFREMGLGDMGWIDLIQDKDQWRAVVNTLMNLQVP